MTEFFVSYAQNYEDVYLWRALKHVERGRYIDVGAYDPDNDSVTRAFYERGWRGVNLEPTQECFERLCEARSEDMNLNMAAGSAEGSITLYEVAGTGMSTPVYANALRVGENGFPFQAREVPVVTLNKVWRDLSLDMVHFLKIDVEGAEEAVLRGLDLSKHRPWIIVIESTMPNSPEENFTLWESILISADYHYATFDGLNRYYVAKEHQDLCTQLAKPPNFFDHFVRAGEFEAQQEAERLRQVEQALHERLAQTEAGREVLGQKVDQLHGRMQELQHSNDLLRMTVEMMYQSRSWRYTAPLRKAKYRLSLALQALRGQDWRVAQAPLHALRGAGRWAASRSVLRRPAKGLLARWPGLRWRIWRFLLTTPEATMAGPFAAGSRSTRNTQNAWTKKNDQKDFKMFAMSEPRQAIDVTELKARIHREREVHRTG